MIWYVVVFFIGMLAGGILFPDGTESDRNEPRDPDQSSGQYWSIYVEATNDPAIYECVYERNNREIYRVEGRSVTSAMENMVDAIQP